MGGGGVCRARVVHGGAGVVCAWRARVPTAPPYRTHRSCLRRLRLRGVQLAHHHVAAIVQHGAVECLLALPVYAGWGWARGVVGWAIG